jgi:hypothetical protein
VTLSANLARVFKQVTPLPHTSLMAATALVGVVFGNLALHAWLCVAHPQLVTRLLGGREGPQLTSSWLQAQNVPSITILS